MSDGQITLQEMVQTAIDADGKGVPVDWKNLAMFVYNAATNHIAQLEAQLEGTNNGEGD